MPDIQIISREIFEGTDPEILSRVVGRDNVALTSGDVTTGTGTIDGSDGTAGTGLDLYIYSLPDKTLVDSWLGIDVDAGGPGDTRVVYDTLQTDSKWSADTIGYNFTLPILQAMLTTAFEGGHTYRIEAILNTSAWGKVPVVAEYTVTPLIST